MVVKIIALLQYNTKFPVPCNQWPFVTAPGMPHKTQWWDRITSVTVHHLLKNRCWGFPLHQTSPTTPFGVPKSVDRGCVLQPAGFECPTIFSWKWRIAPLVLCPSMHRCYLRMYGSKLKMIFTTCHFQRHEEKNDLLCTLVPSESSWISSWINCAILFKYSQCCFTSRTRIICSSFSLVTSMTLS